VVWEKEMKKARVSAVFECRITVTIICPIHGSLDEQEFVERKGNYVIYKFR